MKSISYAVSFSCVFLLACGGGGGGDSGNSGNAGNQTVIPVASILTFNPAAAIEKLYTTNATFTSGTTRRSLTNGAPEVINGVTYQVQNAITIYSDNSSSTSKTYFTQNPFRIYTPKYYYLTGYPSYNTVFVTRTSQPLPTAVKVTDFGLYETVRTETCFNKTSTGCVGVGTIGEVTSIWTVDADTVSTIKFCYGFSPSQIVSPLTCFIINSNNEVTSSTY